MTHFPEFIFQMVSKRSHVMSGSSGRDLQWLPGKGIIFWWILLCARSHLLNPNEVYSPVSFTCSAALWLLPLFPSQIISLSPAYWPYHVAVVTKILFHIWYPEFLFFQASTLQICHFYWAKFPHLFISFLLSLFFLLLHILLSISSLFALPI